MQAKVGETVWVRGLGTAINQRGRTPEPSSSNDTIPQGTNCLSAVSRGKQVQPSMWVLMTVRACEFVKTHRVDVSAADDCSGQSQCTTGQSQCTKQSISMQRHDSRAQPLIIRHAIHDSL